MTISTELMYKIYLGNGVNLTFPYPFLTLDADDLVVKKIVIATGAETLLTRTSEYTVSDVGNPAGGDVVLTGAGDGTAPTALENLVVSRILDILQEIDYIESDDFPANTHEEGLDIGIMIDQQIQWGLDRAIKLAENLDPAIISVLLPIPEAGAPIGWNDAADGLENWPDNMHTVKVDTDSTPDFLGAAAGDGVLRVGSNITYVDGGDFITLDVSSTPSFTDITITGDLILGGYTVDGIINDDTMATASATTLATSLSIKTYIDDQLDTQDTFIEHTDTPAAYAGQAGLLVRVNATPDALEFIDGLTLYAPLSHVSDDGSSHSDVVLNTTHRGSDGKDHSDVVLNNTHRTSNGSDHTFIDQDVTNGSAPVLDGTNFTNLPAGFADPMSTRGDLIYRNAANATVRLPAGANTFILTSDGTDISWAAAAGGGGSGETAEVDITQGAHGFAVGDLLYLVGTVYTLAQADTAVKAEVVGMVSAISPPNDFTMVTQGKVTGLAGLTAGTVYFLDDAVAGGMEVTPGTISKPIFIADTTTSGFFFNMRGLTGGATAPTLDSAYDGGGAGLGRTITADSGNVVITGSLDVTATIDALTLTDGTASLSAGALTGLTTPLTFAQGGTGLASWTQYLIPYAATTTSIGQIAIGTASQVLTSNGAGSAPTFQDAGGGAGPGSAAYDSGWLDLSGNADATENTIAHSLGRFPYWYIVYWSDSNPGSYIYLCPLNDQEDAAIIGTGCRADATNFKWFIDTTVASQRDLYSVGAENNEPSYNTGYLRILAW